jgi:putative Mn2+ efflux pump MntP
MQLGFVLGLDNVAVALALGPLVLSTRRTALLAVLFGLAEALMPFAGTFAAIGGFAPVGDAAHAVRVTVLATFATMVLGLTLVRREPGVVVGHPAMLVALAVLLGLDNFAAGATGGVAGPAALATAGLVSGTLAFAACLTSGAVVQRVARRSLSLVSAVVLAALAVAGLV